MTDCTDVPTVDHWNVARLNLFYSYYLGIFSSQLSWFHFYIFLGGLLIILINCGISLSPFLDAVKMSVSNVSS